MNTLQASFSGGEFSPSLHARVDVQKFSTGLKKAKNFIIHPHGGASNRSGTQFLNKTKLTTKKSRVISFEFSVEQSIVMEFGENYIRFFKDGGVILDGALSIYEVVTPYLEADLSKIKTVQSADVVFIFHPDYPIKRLTRFSDNNWTLEDFPVINGPFMPISSDVKMNPYAASGYLPPFDGVWIPGDSMMIGTPSLDTFVVNHIGSIFKINQYVQSQSFYLVYTATGTSPDMVIKGTWRISTRGVWGGTIKVRRRSIVDGSPVEVIRTLIHNSTDNNLDISGFEDELYFLSIEVAYFGGGTCHLDMSCDSYSSVGIMEVKSFINAKYVEGIARAPFLAIVGAPVASVSWQEGSWSPYRGFPSCGGFYQDRLVAAATRSEQQTVWTSKTGNYVDFGVSRPLESTDSVSVNLPSRKMNTIKNLVILSEMLTFTTGAEFGIGELGGVFSPSTVKTKVYGYRGSSETEPVIVGNRAIAVQAMGSIIRDYGYDLNSDGYAGNDLSIFSSHLLKDHSIVEMAYQQEPDSIVWLVRSDGKLLSMTYMREQDVIAWTWHETDGLFESICSIPGDNQNDIYFVVNRDGHRFIEKLSKRLATPTIEEAVFVDSSLTYRGVKTSTISGLSHLNGKEVNALADGHVVTGLLVAFGSITLPFEAEIVHIGLPYVSDLETLEIQIPNDNGTSSGKFSKVSDVGFKFLNSRGGSIGPDENSLDDVQDLSPLYIADPKQMYSGDYKQVINSGYEKGSSVLFRQSLPLPTTILSIIPNITLGERR